MNQDAVSARIAAGLAKAALILGADFTQYRPTTSLDPLRPGSSIAVLCCAVDHDSDLGFASPTPPDRPFALLLADPGAVQPGDYLVGSDTYFISRKLPFQPAWCVLCNGQFDILDTNQSTSAGANAYGGVTSSNNTLVAQGWPMSVLEKQHSGLEIAILPSDTRLAFFEVLMPSIPGLALGLGLCLRDSSQQIYQIMSYEVSGYGCKLLVSLATT